MVNPPKVGLNKIIKVKMTDNAPLASIQPHPSQRYFFISKANPKVAKSLDIKKGNDKRNEGDGDRRIEK